MSESPYEHDHEEEMQANIERAVEEARITSGDITGNLANEFREFGRQLIRAMRSVATSPELRNVGQEIVDSLKHIGSEMQNAYESTKEREEVRGLGEQAKRVGQTITDKTRTKELATDVQHGLSKALHSLNEELNKVIDQVQSRTARVSDEVEGTAKDIADDAGDAIEEVGDDAGDAMRNFGDEVDDRADEVADILDTKIDDASDSGTWR